MSSKHYMFSVKNAVKYGVDESIMLNNLLFWLDENKANNINIHNGRVWTYNSAKAFTKLFPFWNQRRIARILLSLEDQGAIESGCYNKAGYDKTKWYSSPLLDSYTKFVQSNDQICPIEQPDLSNGTTRFVQPIPDSKPNKNTDRTLSPSDPLVTRAKKLQRMRETTALDASDLRALKAASPILREITESEWNLLERFYALPQKETFSRKTFSTMLNNINGEISKARDWFSKSESEANITTKPVDWSNYE